MTEDFGEPSTSSRSLAGATILQIVPAMRHEASARTALSAATMLLRAGARALVAAADGPLVDELRSHGGEWVRLATETINPLAARRNVRLLEHLIASERIDIVHAHDAGGADCAHKAAAKLAVRLVTTLPDVPPTTARAFSRIAALAHADHIIAPSVFAATPVIEHFGIPREQVTIIPPSIDTARFDPQAVPAQHVDVLRQAWRIAPDERVVLTPGRVAPWNGQTLLPDVARMLAGEGHRGLVFAVVGENRSHRRYARSVIARAKAQGVVESFRMTGHCPDLPAALALSDIVAITALEAPVLGRDAAQAQAMGRPVVTSDVGALPERVVVPPYLPEDVRTGWVATANDAADFARALGLALALDPTGYQAMSARARQFAEYMFSPENVAAAVVAVYASLLGRDL